MCVRQLTEAGQQWMLRWVCNFTKVYCTCVPGELASSVYTIVSLHKPANPIYAKYKYDLSIFLFDSLLCKNMTKLQETVLEERKRREKESVKNVGIHVPGVWASRKK
jgi:hypothetical protein